METPKAPLQIERINTTRKTDKIPDGKPVRGVKETTPSPKKERKKKYDPLKPDLGYVTFERSVLFPDLPRELAVKILDKYGKGYVGEDNTTGRPSKKHNGIPDYMIQYFRSFPVSKATTKQTVVGFNIQTIVVNEVGDMPTFQSFAHHIGIFEKTLEQRRYHPEHFFSDSFSSAYDKCKQIQMNRIIEATQRGLIGVARAKFILSNNHGMKDQKSVEKTDNTKKEALQNLAEKIQEAEGSEGVENLKSLYFDLVNEK